jgi:hypothetical protein
MADLPKQRSPILGVSELILIAPLLEITVTLIALFELVLTIEAIEISPPATIRVGCESLTTPLTLRLPGVEIVISCVELEVSTVVLSITMFSATFKLDAISSGSRQLSLA